MDIISTAGLPAKASCTPSPVVGVEIHVQHALHAALEHGHDREYRIVEIAEAAGPVWPSVVRAAGRVEHDPALEREFGREDRSANGRRRAGEHAGEQRILQSAEVKRSRTAGWTLPGSRRRRAGPST